MRKRRKKAVIEYDYEAAYNKALEDLEEDQVQRILQGSRKATVYATKEIRAGDQLEVEIYPEFVRGQQEEIPPTAAQKEKHRKAQWNLNEKNSRKQCERVINANFGDRDIWATFTYTDEEMPATMEEALKNMQNYIRRLNYQRKKRWPEERPVRLHHGGDAGRKVPPSHSHGWGHRHGHCGRTVDKGKAESGAPPGQG